MQRLDPLGFEVRGPSQLIEPCSVTLANSHVREARAWSGITIPKMYRILYRWAACNRPQALATNARPGPALFLGWLAKFHGWPLTVVVYRTQIDSAESFRPLVNEVIAYADEYIVRETIAERDKTIEDLGWYSLDLQDLGWASGIGEAGDRGNREGSAAGEESSGRAGEHSASSPRSEGADRHRRFVTRTIDGEGLPEDGSGHERCVQPFQLFKDDQADEG